MPEDILTRLMKIPRQIALFRARLVFYVGQVKSHLQQHWKKYAALAVVMFFILKKDVSINLELTGPAFTDVPAADSRDQESHRGAVGRSTSAEAAEQARPRNVSQLMVEEDETSLFQDLLTGLWDFFTGGDDPPVLEAEETDIPEDKPLSAAERRRAEKIRKQKDYVRKYVEVAQQEMEEFNIPASITLAQGILESNAGESSLARKNNNHFGIKCFSRRCNKGHCSNFNDDHHKDFFRIYRSPEESYRDHSIFLQSKRYRSLFNLKTTDYKGWARGLKKAGYATDRNYADKLINLIEELKLYRYDRR